MSQEAPGVVGDEVQPWHMCLPVGVCSAECTRPQGHGGFV